MNIPEATFQRGRAMSQGEQMVDALSALERACSADDTDVRAAAVHIRVTLEAELRRLRSLGQWLRTMQEPGR